MGTNKSKGSSGKTKPKEIPSIQNNYKNILLLCPNSSGKTAFIRAISETTNNPISNGDQTLEQILDDHCRMMFLDILFGIKDLTMDEIFDRNDGNVNCEMESVVESLKRCPKNGWNSVLDQYSYKVYANLWINYPKLREIFAKSLIVFVPEEVIVNYDQFFRLINKGEISMNLLKYIRFQKDSTRELKLEIRNESFLLVDVKKYTTLSNRQARLKRWYDLNSNAKFGIVIESLISYDHPFEFSEYEFLDSIEIIKEYLTNKASKELRIVFMFTMADLLYEKSTFQSKNLKEPTRDRIELKHIGNMNKERDLINSVLDFYQNVFEIFRENEKFEYHIINNLSSDESYQALIESNKESDDPTKQVIISRSLIRRSLGVLYKMIGQSQLSDISILITD